MIEALIKNEKYKKICLSLAGANWEELFQDSILNLLSADMAKIANLDGYFCSIIYNTNKGWYLRKLNAVPISEITTINEDDSEQESALFCVPVDETETQIKETAAEILIQVEGLINSPNKKTKECALMLKEHLGGKSIAAISKEMAINYRVAYDAIQHAKDLIKQNMTGQTTKNEIFVKLKSEGVTASYSGKNKTFYINRTPSEKLMIMIKNSGFKTKEK